MPRLLKIDLARLRALAFRRYQTCGKLVEQFHASDRLIDRRDDAALIWNIYAWLMVPLSLWPIDFAGTAHYTLSAVRAGKKFDDQFVLLLKMIGAPPKPEACGIMGVYEHDIANGRYEKLVKRQEKFDELEKRLKDNAAFRDAWKQINARFDVAKYRNRRGVIRRMLSKERNLRDELVFKWRTPDDRFRVLFDALCYHWNLYGVEKSRPLLLKITVNPTPHGTMIFVPRYWSLDLHRDLKTKEISRLHRAHGGARQGPKLSLSRMDRQEEAQAALAYWNQATCDGLRGDRRYETVLKQLKKVDGTDFSHVKRLLRFARTL
jgi:hypothetical protein